MSEHQVVDWVTLLFLVIGVFFMFVGALGILRMPDLFMRMSATTKSSTMGVIFTLLAASIHFYEDLGSATRILATIVFVLMTAPVAAHMIARAAYFSGVNLWENTIADELEGKYDKERDILISRPPMTHSEAAKTREVPASTVHEE